MSDPYVEDLRACAAAAAQVANYCDHADHNEPADATWVIGAAQTFRSVALRIAAREGVDLLELYGRRLRAIELRSVAAASRDAFDAEVAVGRAVSWRDLQRAQLEHDRQYHPDVLGLHKSEQLRHYALHLGKLVGALAKQPAHGAAHEDFVDRRLPDMAIFGVKLVTVMNEQMSDAPVLPRHTASAPFEALR
jgi:hypothetical protein